MAEMKVDHWEYMMVVSLVDGSVENLVEQRVLL